jgi:tRNA threonylcarbamoyl adenosine modification protein (Sua5/YciO/YrdC/YwlC family)
MEKIFTSDQAVTILNDGGIGVLPTDTVYGVVAKATEKNAVEQLYELKQRERKPGTIVAAAMEQLISLGISEEYLKAGEKYWPGSLSIVLPLEGEYGYIHQGVGTVAVRVVADERLRDILQQTGPLVTSSANHPGKPEATTVQEAINYFGDKVDFYVDGGDLSDRASSTIIRPTARGIEIIRQGAVRLNN